MKRKGELGMERFISQQNIKRYQRLLDIASDESQRRQIQNLLAEEEEKARGLGCTKFAERESP